MSEVGFAGIASSRQGRGLLAAAVTVAAIAAGVQASSAQEPATATAPADPAATVPWGFNDDWGFTAGAWTSRATKQQLRLAEAIIPDSLSANRFHVQWAQVERRPGSYRWKRTDRIYTAMQKVGDDPVMLLYNAPRWARRPDASCPAADNDLACAYPPRKRYDERWAKFVAVAAHRYRGVRAVEIWNEPNLGRFWAPRPKPRRYADLLAAAHDAVASTGLAIPVVTGGATPSGNSRVNISAAEFLRRVYRLGCSCDFEGIGSHPYPRHPPFVDKMTKWLNKLRAVRDDAGDASTPIWITEVGISTGPDLGVTLDDQDLLVELYRSVEGGDVASFIIHRLHDINYEGPYWSNTGVLSQDLAPKPAYCALSAGIGTETASCAPPEAG